MTINSGLPGKDMLNFEGPDVSFKVAHCFASPALWGTGFCRPLVLFLLWIPAFSNCALDLIVFFVASLKTQGVGLFSCGCFHTKYFYHISEVHPWYYVNPVYLLYKLFYSQYILIILFPFPCSFQILPTSLPTHPASCSFSLTLSQEEP